MDSGDRVNVSSLWHLLTVTTIHSTVLEAVSKFGEVMLK